VTVAKQIPAGTVAEVTPGVVTETNLVGVAPAGPDPMAKPITPASAVTAAPKPNRDRTEDSLRVDLAHQVRNPRT
jgi:hypothetical protein